MKNKILSVLSALAVLSVFGFVAWLLNTHGVFGMFRVMPIFLYVLWVVIVLGAVIIGLSVWYWRLSIRGKGKRLFIVNFTISAICIILFPIIFIQLGGFPPSKDLKPMPMLSIPAGESANVHFAVGSDAHIGAGTNNPDKTIAMLRQINNPANDYNAFFFLGDLVEYGFKDTMWENALDTFSSTASLIPTRFVPGNHDTMFGGMSRYIDVCSPGAKDTKLWYRIDICQVHFLMLDVEWTDETFTKEQANWLETQLSTIPTNDWKIVMSHGFYYASGATSLGWNWYDNEETISALTPLFEKYGVNLVFSGHNHYLELLQHSGVNYVICGGFGGKPDPTPTYVSPSSIWLKQGQAGFVDVKIDGNLAILNFRDPDSNILKTFTLAKR